MSDNFEMLVDADVTPSEAKGVARAVIGRFRKLGLIAGRANGDCVLGGLGFRPGRQIANFYETESDEYQFWKLRTCGVEPKVGRAFNVWALGPSFEGFKCPACGADLRRSERPSGVGDAIGEWMDESGPALLQCPKCRKERPVTEWECKPPLGFGYVSFTFWNWPRLDSPSWKIDIVGIVREVSGHTVVKTHGHI
jgi:hypothetical protein